MSLRKIDNGKLRLKDCSSRRTKYYYHPSKCPRSWPNYKTCLNALGREPSLSTVSSRELQTYPRLTSIENLPPKLRENPGSLNIIVTEDSRKTLRMRRSRTKNKSKVVSSSSDDSLRLAFLTDYKYTKKGPKHHLVQQVMAMKENGEKGKDNCKSYCDNFFKRSPPNANQLPNNPTRRYSQTRDMYNSKSSIEAQSKRCGGYCGKFLTGEHPQSADPSESKSTHPSESHEEEKPKREQKPRYSDLEPPKTTSFTLLRKPVQSYEEIQQKYKEGEALIDDKPFLLYQHPTDRATRTEIEALKRSQAANHQDNENNKASMSSQNNDRRSFQEQDDVRNRTQEPPSMNENSTRTGARSQSILDETFDRYSDPKPQNSILKEEGISRGNENLMNGAVSREPDKNFESIPSTSSETTTDVRPFQKKSLAEDTSKKSVCRGCFCEENKIPRKQQNTSVPRVSDYPKYGSMKEMTTIKSTIDEDNPPCFCDANKANKSRSTQPQESPKKEEMIDAYTQVSKQIDASTSEYKTGKRTSGVSAVSFGKDSFGPVDNMSQQSSPIMNSPSILPPPELPIAMKVDPNVPYMYPDPRISYNSPQFGLDQSAWRLPYSGARPEWRILAPTQILGSSQFRSSLPVNSIQQYYGNGGFMLPQMVNRNQLTLHKVLNPPYLQQTPYSQPNVGCCTSKLSISTSGIEYHHRSARCSVGGLQNRSTQKLNPSMSLGGMPISAGIEPSNMSQGLLPPTALGPTDMTQIAMPIYGANQAMMPGVSQMGVPSTNNGMYPVQGSMRGVSTEHMPYAFFPWAYRESQQRAMLNPEKMDSVSLDTTYIPPTPRNTLSSQAGGPQTDFLRQSMAVPGSHLQQERINQIDYTSQGTNFYQPENYYPPQKSLSSSAAPYFSGGYSSECINKFKCRDPYCNQNSEMQPNQLAVPSTSFYDPNCPSRNMRESQPTSHDALNKSGMEISSHPSTHSALTPKMVSCGPSKSCISISDKGIICSALAPIRMCARDPQAGIPCGRKKSAADVSKEESTYQSGTTLQSFGDPQRPTVASIMEGIMCNVTKKASRGCSYACSQAPLPHHIRDDHHPHHEDHHHPHHEDHHHRHHEDHHHPHYEDYHHPHYEDDYHSRRSTVARYTSVSRGSHLPWRGSRGFSMVENEPRGSSRRLSRPRQSHDKRKSSMKDRLSSFLSHGGSRSRGTSPGVGGRRGSNSHGQSISRTSRMSRGTSPGLQGRSFGSRGSRGSSSGPKSISFASRGSRASSPGLQGTSFASRGSRASSPGLQGTSFASRGSRASSPGLQGKSLGSRGSRMSRSGSRSGADLNVNRSRTSRASSPELGSKSFTGESIGNSLVGRSSGSIGTMSVSKQSGQPSPSKESIRFTDRSSKYNPQGQPEGFSKKGGKGAFNPNTTSESVKKEANAMKANAGPGFTRTKSRTAHGLQNMQSGDDENTPPNKPATMNQKTVALKPATNTPRTKGGAGDQGRANKNKPQATQLNSNSGVSNKKQSQQKQQKQQRISQTPSQQRLSQPSSQQSLSLTPSKQRSSQQLSQQRGSQSQRGSQLSQQRGSQSQQRGSQSQQRGSQSQLRGSQSQLRGSQSQQRGSQSQQKQTIDAGTQMQEDGNSRRSTRESQKRGSQRESDRQSKTSKMSLPAYGMHHGGTSSESIYSRYL